MHTIIALGTSATERFPSLSSTSRQPGVVSSSLSLLASDDKLLVFQAGHDGTVHVGADESHLATLVPVLQAAAGAGPVAATTPRRAPVVLSAAAVVVRCCGVAVKESVDVAVAAHSSLSLSLLLVGQWICPDVHLLVTPGQTHARSFGDELRMARGGCFLAVGAQRALDHHLETLLGWTERGRERKKANNRANVGSSPRNIAGMDRKRERKKES